MRRLGQLTGLIGGVVLLMVTAGVGVARTRDGEVEVVLVSDTGGMAIASDAYYLLFPKSRDVIDLQVSTENMIYHGQSADGEWLYFERLVLGHSATLFRIRPTGRDRQDILQNDAPNQLVWSADRNTLFYVKPSAVGGYDLWRMQADGREAQNIQKQNAQNLTEAHGLRLYPAYARPVVTAAAGWLYFSATPNTPNGVAGVYRMRPDGTALEPLTDRWMDSMVLIGLLPDGQGMIVECGLAVCKVPFVGLLIEILIPPEAATTTFKAYTLLPEAGVLVVQRDDQVSLIRLADGAALWQPTQPDTSHRVENVHPSGAWIYIDEFFPNESPNRNVIHVVPTDGSGQAALPNLGSFTSWGWTGDGEWLLFESVNQTLNQVELLRLRAGTHEVEFLRPLVTIAHFAQWTPERDWVYFVDGQPWEPPRQVYRMRPDGTELQNLTPDDSPFVGAVYVDTITNFEMEWQPAALVGAGAVLLVIGVMIKRMRAAQKIA